MFLQDENQFVGLNVPSVKENACVVSTDPRKFRQVYEIRHPHIGAELRIYEHIHFYASTWMLCAYSLAPQSNILCVTGERLFCALFPQCNPELFQAARFALPPVPDNETMLHSLFVFPS